MLAFPSDDSVASYLLSLYSKFGIHVGSGDELPVQEGPFEQSNDKLQSSMEETAALTNSKTSRHMFSSPFPTTEATSVWKTNDKRILQGK